jgi:AcrR family transcriptional regulator
MPPAKKLSPETGRKSAYVARNRMSIINAALEVFAENGLHTTMDQVAEASVMAMSTVYKHFKDKDDVLICKKIHISEFKEFFDCTLLNIIEKEDGRIIENYKVNSEVFDTLRYRSLIY